MFGGEVDERIAAVHAAIDGLEEIELATLDQEALARYVVAVHRLQSRMEAKAVASVGAFDRFGDPEGAAGAAPWVAWKCRVKKSRAKAELSRARELRRMPEAAAAFDAGSISGEHVGVLGAAQRSAPESFEKVEAVLVEAATEQRFERFQREVAYARPTLDPDGTAAEAQDAFERRRAWAARTFEGTVEESATLDPVGGAIYLKELNRLERELFEADWREARGRLGDAATIADLQRTSEQRYADAKVQMAIRSAAMPADARQARILFTVLIGYETFYGMMSQLADGTVLCPEQLVPWLADVDVERVVFDGPSRAVDVGAKQRLFTGATRRSVEVRDLFCTHESCDVPYERCDIDHIQRWEHGGATTQANGRVRCPRHNPGRRRPRSQSPPDDN